MYADATTSSYEVFPGCNGCINSRAVKVSALIYAINVAEINAIKYFNAVNTTLFTSGVFPDRKPLRACSQ